MVDHATAIAQQEAVLRGDDCPSCGARWVADPESPGDVQDLTHRLDCELDQFLDRAVLMIGLREAAAACGMQETDVDPDSFTFTVEDRFTVTIGEVPT